MERAEERTLTPEERRLARLREIQRRLFPGDARLMYGDCRPLQVPIREVILCRQHGRSA